MSVISSDIKYYLTPTGNSDPTASLGGAGYGDEIPATIHALFAQIGPAEATAGSVKYRAIGVKNTNATDTLFDAVLYISTETSSVDDIIAVAYDTGTQSVADEDTAPSAPALSFSTPTTKETGIALGDIAAGALKRIWLRRTVTAGASSGTSTGALSVAGGTT